MFTIRRLSDYCYSPLIPVLLKILGKEEYFPISSFILASKWKHPHAACNLWGALVAEEILRDGYWFAWPYSRLSPSKFILNMVITGRAAFVLD